ncbi:hypothetical protein RQP46_004612 [Phenoliferia psychrophenolica]
MAQSIDVNPPAGAAASSSSATATNGHHPASSSASHGNGNGNGATELEVESVTDAMDYEHGEVFKPLWEGSDIDKREFVRLTLQALKEIGYTGTADALRAESGFTLETPTVTDFRKGILEGHWDVVERLLDDLPPDAITDVTTVRFAILQQKFLEALEAQNTKAALTILRNELAPLQHDSQRLHMLSSWIMCNGPEDLRNKAGWDGVAGQSREHLLIDLQQYISPSVLIPQRRLAQLLEQAKQYQRMHCPFHAVDAPISLLADCNCDPAMFPTVTTHILEEHTDEIWRLEFSHDGEWLATAGRDKTVIIWKVNDNFSKDKVFAEHVDPIGSLAWSPDDSILLTAAESVIKMWNTETGVCINTLTDHIYPIGALAWFPSGKGFISGGMDSKVCSWDLAGNMSSILPSPSSTSRVLDCAITPDGNRLVIVGRADVSPSALLGQSVGGSSSAAGSRGGTPAPTPPIMARHEKRITVVDLNTKKIEYDITQPGELTSVEISSDSRFALVSHAPNEILYIDLRDGTIVRRFLGHDQGQYVLQSTFGGALENYVCSGSEDGKVYLWHRDTGQLVHVLEGHGGGSVNAVAWNRRHPGMFASCSDDRTVRIWGFPPQRKAGAMSP